MSGFVEIAVDQYLKRHLGTRHGVFDRVLHPFHGRAMLVLVLRAHYLESFG